MNGFIEPLWSEKPGTGCKGEKNRKEETLHLLLGGTVLIGREWHPHDAGESNVDSSNLL